MPDSKPESKPKENKEDFKAAFKRIISCNRWVYSLNIKGTDKLVLIYLSNEIIKPFTTRKAANNAIAANTRLDPKTVKLSLERLQSLGLIEGLEGNRYQLNFVESDGRKITYLIAMRLVNLNRLFFQASALSSTELLVLLSILDHVDKDGKCFLSYKTIIKKTGLTRNTIPKTVKALAESGGFALKRYTRNNGGNSVYRYQFWDNPSEEGED